MRLRSTTPASKLLAKSHQFIAKRRSHQHKQRKEEDDPLDLPVGVAKHCFLLQYARL